MAKKDLTKQEKSDKKEPESKGSLSFISDTKEELTKVVWPSRQQLLSESVAVMLMVTLVATVIYLVDNFFTWGAGKVFG